MAGITTSTARGSSTARGYGDAVAHSFRLEGAPRLVTSSFPDSQIAVSRLSIGPNQMGMTPRIPPEDTFIVALYLTGVPHHELWSRGRLMLRQGYATNAMRIVNLTDEYSALVACPHETLVFYIPRQALNDFADEAGIPRITELSCQPGIVDPVMAQLASILRAAVEHPEQANALMVEHLVLAACARLASRHGGSRSAHPLAKGGLTPRQAARAEAFLLAHLTDSITLADVALHCGLSRAHFAKAFHRTTGLAPHQWLMRRRVDKAKAMMLETPQPIGEVAIACGFADQSHLTRVFTRLTGASPAEWRRQRRS